MTTNQLEIDSQIPNKASKTKMPIAEPVLSPKVVILYKNQEDGHYAVGESFEKPPAVNSTVSPALNIWQSSYITDDSFVYLQPGLQEIDRSDLKIIADHMGSERFGRVVQVFEKRADLSPDAYKDNLEDYDLESIKVILMGCDNLEKLESVARGVTTKRLLMAIENRRKQLESEIRRRASGGNKVIEAKSTIAPLVMQQRYGNDLGL